MNEFVIDASFAAAWCFADEVTDATELCLRLAVTHGIIVPALWKLEIANMIRSAERRERLSVADANSRLHFLKGLVILEDETSLELAWGQIMSLARNLGLTPYDATYVELAQRLELPLASRDKLMIAAAKSLDIALVTA